MQYVWQHKLFVAHDLFSTDGEPIQVIDVGRLNSDAGPDFFNSKVRIGGSVWAGNVEIHCSSSDWKRHNHHANKAYDSVILHVVAVADCEVRRTNGEVIPQLVMRCSPTFHRDYEQLLCQSSLLTCCKSLTEADNLLVSGWISALAMERLQEKTERVMQWLELYRGSWEEVCYVTFARNLGFSINSDAFERLARSLPLIFIQKHADSLFQIEALLFGQAGLLADVLDSDDIYSKQLAKEYAFLRNKFGLTPMPAESWRFFRLRPANFPHKRIALLAQILHGGFQLFTAICETKEEKKIKALFNRTLTGYWSEHYLFGHPSSHSSCCLSNSALDIILINTVTPLLYAYGIKTSGEEYCERAMELLEGIKPEQNSIVRHFSEVGVRANSALESQALIQLHRAYCEPKKCLFCRIGHKILSRSALLPIKS